MENPESASSPPFSETCARLPISQKFGTPGKLRSYLNWDMSQSPKKTKSKDEKVSTFCPNFLRHKKVFYDSPPRIPHNPLSYSFKVKKSPDFNNEP